MAVSANDLSLSIRFDENCSRTVPRDELAAFLERLPGVARESANDFVLHASHEAQVHIILDCVRVQEDRLISCHPSPDAINCVRLLLNGAARTTDSEREAQLLAFQLAKHLRWRLHDDSEVNAWLALDELFQATIVEDRPWWHFWR